MRRARRAIADDIEDVIDDPAIFNGRITSVVFRTYRDKGGVILADYFYAPWRRGKLNTVQFFGSAFQNRCPLPEGLPLGGRTVMQFLVWNV